MADCPKKPTQMSGREQQRSAMYSIHPGAGAFSTEEPETGERLSLEKLVQKMAPEVTEFEEMSRQLEIDLEARTKITDLMARHRKMPILYEQLKMEGRDLTEIAVKMEKRLHQLLKLPDSSQRVSRGLETVPAKGRNRARVA